MATVVITGQVEDSAKWEANFPTHRDVFRSYTATSVRYGTTEDNDVITIWEVKDADTMLSLIDSEETAEAMQSDGVKRETVKVYVVDKALSV